MCALFATKPGRGLIFFVLLLVVVLVLNVWVFGVGYGHFAEAADRVRHEWDS